MSTTFLSSRRQWLPIAAALLGTCAVVLELSHRSTPRKRSILIINPNTTQSMTDALRPVVEKLDYKDTTYTFFTAPSGVGSINNEEDGAISARACLPALRPLIDKYDAFLVCCYSAHPLIPALRAEITEATSIEQGQSTKDKSIQRKPVAGIFEASVGTCLQLLSFTDPAGDIEGEAKAKFAIVTTGDQYEPLLNAAVNALLVSGDDDEKKQPSIKTERFAGTFTTGLNADELHSTPQAEVHRRMKKAARQALQRGARALCLGCAGMVGLEGAVREACVETLGREEGERVWIVDGVMSGVAVLEGVLRSAK